MEDVISEIFQWLFKSYPAIITAVGAIIICLYILGQIKDVFYKEGDEESFATKMKYFFFFWLKRKKKKVVEPKPVHYTDEDRQKVVDKLLIHNFFLAVSNIRNQIPSMDFGHQKKSEALRDVIKIYVDTIEKYASTILKNYKLDELSMSKLNEILISEIDKATYEIYNRMKDRLGEALYIKLIEDPVKGFKARNAIFREIFVNGVLLISTQAMSVYNYDNYERASEILTSMYVALQVIVKNFEKVFKDYNGELDKYLN